MQNLQIFLIVVSLIILGSFFLGMKEANQDTMEDYKELYNKWEFYVVLVLALGVAFYPMIVSKLNLSGMSL